MTQDEALKGLGDGDTSPDAKTEPTANQVSVRAERSGAGDGRAYRISFTGSDGRGGTCTGSVTVGVPHDQGQGSTPVDSGQAVNSFGPYRAADFAQTHTKGPLRRALRIRTLSQLGVGIGGPQPEAGPRSRRPAAAPVVR